MGLGCGFGLGDGLGLEGLSEGLGLRLVGLLIGVLVGLAHWLAIGLGVGLLRIRLVRLPIGLAIRLPVRLTIGLSIRHLTIARLRLRLRIKLIKLQPLPLPLPLPLLPNTLSRHTRLLHLDNRINFLRRGHINRIEKIDLGYVLCWGRAVCGLGVLCWAWWIGFYGCRFLAGFLELLCYFLEGFLVAVGALFVASCACDVRHHQRFINRWSILLALLLGLILI